MTTDKVKELGPFVKYQCLDAEGKKSHEHKENLVASNE
jgi:hypothetical protein